MYEPKCYRSCVDVGWSINRCFIGSVQNGLGHGRMWLNCGFGDNI